MLFTGFDWAIPKITPGSYAISCKLVKAINVNLALGRALLKLSSILESADCSASACRTP